MTNPKDLVNLEDFKERFQDTAISDYRSTSDIKKAVGEMEKTTTREPLTIASFRPAHRNQLRKEILTALGIEGEVR